MEKKPFSLDKAKEIQKYFENALQGKAFVPGNIENGTVNGVIVVPFNNATDVAQKYVTGLNADIHNHDILSTVHPSDGEYEVMVISIGIPGANDGMATDIRTYITDFSIEHPGFEL